MNKKVKEKWLAALESREFKQGKNTLKKIDKKGITRHCCLGVLVELLDPKHRDLEFRNRAWSSSRKDSVGQKFPYSLYTKAGFTTEHEMKLSNLMDTNDYATSYKPSIKYIRDAF